MKNTVSTYQMTLIIEGLSDLILKAKELKDYDKVNKLQQTVDQLQEYTQEFWEENQNSKDSIQ
tara:strand:- start:542 stop:730 length:189 start_codon:yes stop_codon:yes gene_type:complete